MEGYKIANAIIYFTSLQYKTDGSGVDSLFKTDELKIETDNTNAKRILFGITNFLYNGIDFTKYPNGLSVRDKMSIEVLSYKIIFKYIKDYKEIKQKLTNIGGIDITCESCLEICEPIGDIEQLMRNICHLLSFARGTPIRWIYYKILDQDDVPICIYHIADKPPIPYGGITLIKDNRPWEPDIKYFLEKCYADFCRHKDELKLLTPIEFYLQAKRHDFLSIKFLLSAVTMEYLDSNFRKCHKLKKKGKKNAMSFKKGLEKLFTNFGITNEDFSSFIQLRNKVIHEGIVVIDWEKSILEYNKLLNQIERILMNIMGYDGYYLDIRNNFERTKI